MDFSSNNKGIIFDTLKYLEICINHEDVEVQAKGYNLAPDKVFEYFNYIKGVPIVDKYYALLKRMGKALSPRLLFLTNNLHSINTIEDFVILLDDKQKLMDHLSDYYFADDRKIDENLIMNCEILEPKIRISLALIFGDYENKIKELKDIILGLHKSISQLHKDFEYKISNFKLAEYSKKKIFELSGKAVEKTDNVYISLMHLYGYNYIVRQGDFVWIFGLKANKFLKNYDKYNMLLTINFRDILSIFNLDLAFNIVDIIYKNKEINGAGIIKNLTFNCTDASVYTMLSKLKANKVILISKVEKNRIYFKLNPEFFKSAALLSYNKFNYYTNEALPC